MKLKFILPVTVVALTHLGCQPPQKQEEDIVSKLKPEDLVHGESTTNATTTDNNNTDSAQPLSLAELQARAAQQAANNSAIFEENKGQFGPGAETILYRAQSRDQQFYIRINGWSNVRSSFKPDPKQPEVKAEPGKPAPPPKGTYATHRVDTTWVNYNTNATVEGKNPAQETRNFLGTQAGDIMGVRLFGSVLFKDIYNNIDVEFSSPNNIRQQVYTIRPGGNLNDMRFLVEYADDLKINEKGDLVITTREGDITFGLQVEQNGQEIQSAFVLQKKEEPKPKTKDKIADTKGVTAEFTIQLKGEVNTAAPYTVTLIER